MLHEEQTDQDSQATFVEASIGSGESARVLAALIGCIVVAEGSLDVAADRPAQAETLP